MGKTENNISDASANLGEHPAKERVIPEILQGRKFLDPNYDPAFRALLGEKEALQSFLDAILHLEEGRRIKTLEFTFQDSLEFRTPEPKTVIFDVHAWTEDNRCLDIELQRAKHSFFVDRVLLYSAFLAIKGKQKMDASPEYAALPENERKRRRYQLPEVISLWSGNFTPIPERDAPYHDSWSVYSDYEVSKGACRAIERSANKAPTSDSLESAKPISDKIKYIIVDLPKYAKANPKVNSSEEKWLYLLSHAGKSEDLPDFNDPVLSRAIERIRVTSANDELLKEQAKQMETQDEIDVRIADGVALGMEKGFSKGIALGMEKGVEKGMAKGLEKGMQQGMQQGLARGTQSVIDVMQSLGYSEEKIDEIKRHLAKK